MIEYLELLLDWMPMNKTIEELENELRTKKLQEAEQRRKDRTEKEKNFKKKNKVNVYWSDDYAGMVSDKYSFYYGYEETYCPKHKDEDCEDLYDCELREWCFTASIGNRKVLRVPCSKLWFEYKEPMEMLLLGIGQFLSDPKESNENKS